MCLKTHLNYICVMQIVSLGHPGERASLALNRVWWVPPSSTSSQTITYHFLSPETGCTSTVFFLIMGCLFSYFANFPITIFYKFSNLYKLMLLPSDMSNILVVFVFSFSFAFSLY